MINKELLQLLKDNAVQYNRPDSPPFKLASGKESNYFIDCKRALLTGRGHRFAGRAIANLICMDTKFKDVRFIAGVELGGCSLASAASLMAWEAFYINFDVLYVRKEQKDHGTKSMIEGAGSVKGQVILVEDVITTGQSSMKSLSQLKNNGYKPVSVISVIDRLEGGPQAIEKAYSIPVISLFTVGQLLETTHHS